MRLDGTLESLHGGTSAAPDTKEQVPPKDSLSPIIRNFGDRVIWLLEGEKIVITRRVEDDLVHDLQLFDPENMRLTSERLSSISESMRTRLAKIL